MVTLAERDVAHPEADTALAQSIANRCQTDHWTDDVRSCFATINTEPEADGCMNMLPKQQRQTLTDDRARVAPGGKGEASAVKADEAPADSKPARATRGAVKKEPPKPKPKSKTSDPCEGGE